MKVLIVDDSRRMRRAIKLSLRGLASDTRECEDGDAALAGYEEFLPDWVLMDVEMRRVDGLTAAAEITRTHPEARVLIVTNHDGDELRREAERSGAYGYLLKEQMLDLRGVLSGFSATEAVRGKNEVDAGPALRGSPGGSM
jgi:two-component system response regulator DegU